MSELYSFAFICAVIFLVGYFLAYLLSNYKKQTFWGSRLQTKINMWLPIFAVIIVLALQNFVVSLIIFGFIILGVLHDYVYQKNKQQPVSLIYLVVILLGITALWHMSLVDTYLFLTVWFLSVMSDVVAYFMGSAFKKWPLPHKINAKKSWEGVVGQLIGSYLGYVIIARTIEPTSPILIIIPMWVTVGFGSAAGDITNSYVKRLNGVKDWSSLVPGHGGLIDRLSSLSFASILVWFIYFQLLY